MPKAMSLQFLIKAGRIRLIIHSVCFWDHGPQVKLYRVGFGPVQCLVVMLQVHLHVCRGRVGGSGCEDACIMSIPPRYSSVDHINCCSKIRDSSNSTDARGHNRLVPQITEKEPPDTQHSTLLHASRPDGTDTTNASSRGAEQNINISHHHRHTLS
jgi:hypothetical protein